MKVQLQTEFSFILLGQVWWWLFCSWLSSLKILRK